MEREQYDELLNLAERSDLTYDERRKFIALAEALTDAPGGVHAALPKLLHAVALLSHKETAAANSAREAIRLLRMME
jgi:hypothetical protein